MFELGKMNQYFKYFFNSKNKKVPVNIEAKDSATGKANQTPFIPINFGKIYISGIKKNPCLVKVNSNAGIAFPTA